MISPTLCVSFLPGATVATGDGLLHNEVNGPDFWRMWMSKCPKFWGKALLRTLWQMYLLGNGDRPIAKLGETLTGVSINKPLIRKKRSRAQQQQHRGRISMARSHLYARRALWQAAESHRGLHQWHWLTLAMSMPTLWLCSEPSTSPPFKSSSRLFPRCLLLPSLTSLSAQCPECAAVYSAFTVIDCGGGPPLPRWDRKWRRENRGEWGDNGQSREAWRESVMGNVKRVHSYGHVPPLISARHV